MLTTESLSLYEWHHVALVHNANSQMATLYIDKVDRVSTDEAHPTIAHTGETLKIGSDAYRAGYTNGYIDDIRIYNRALTDEEVLALALEQ